MMGNRLTFRAKVAHCLDDQVMLGDLDITQHVNAFQVKSSSHGMSTVILKLINVPLDLELEADVEMAEVQP